jgi:hypothetical protein
MWIQDRLVLCATSIFASGLGMSETVRILDF